MGSFEAPNNMSVLKSVYPVWWLVSIMVPQGRNPDLCITERTEFDTNIRSILSALCTLVSPVVPCWYSHVSVNPKCLTKCVMV